MIFVIIIFILIIALIIFFDARNRKYTMFIKENSIAIKKLNELNEKTHFFTIEYFDDNHTYDNEKMFKTISCLDYLTYNLQFNQNKVLKQIEKASENKNRFETYCKLVSEIQNFGKYLSPANKYNQKYLLRIEKKLFNNTIIFPAIDFTITINLYCSKINGCIYAKKNNTFKSQEIISLIKRINNKNGTFYKDRDIWDSICRVERGKVSNKMRFSIYKRDGYRCCICGRSDRFNYLEIDHIKPIAKGGKSTYDNLQTLCRRCNKEKGDSY